MKIVEIPYHKNTSKVLLYTRFSPIFRQLLKTLPEDESI